MNEQLYGIGLWVAVAWPLLLAFPALHSRLPWPRHLAILPAAALVLLPDGVSLELPRLLFGTVLALDGGSRWILAMSVTVWLVAATAATSPQHDPASHRAPSFFLLTLAGNLGAVLATDLVGFFSFATLMGYGFYGLFIQGGDAAARRAGRAYLVFLILADLALFEALLLAASTTEPLRYEAVREAMAGTSFSRFYLSMVFVGFALKAGIWPVHRWLSVAYKSAPRSAALLLGGVPVAMGLLGAVRWLPFGEPAFYVSGTVIQITGVAAMLYAALRLFTHAPVKMLPAWATVAVTGAFIAALGTGLAHPALWRQYEYFMYPFIASLGVFPAALVFAIGRLRDTRLPTAFALRRAEALSRWAGQWSGVVRRWAKYGLLGLQSLWHALRVKCEELLWRVRSWQKLLDDAERQLRRWPSAISLLSILGMVIAMLALGS